MKIPLLRFRQFALDHEMTIYGLNTISFEKGRCILTVCFYDNQHIASFQFYKKHQYHRSAEEGPSCCTFRSDGSLGSVFFESNGNLYRPAVQGPAKIHIDENGKIDAEYHSGDDFFQVGRM